ncbi:MAG: L-tyrosine/L-tryptophan isonitrile synthase family protein [Cyanobacteria bacterium HKST-UBA06]|nr:L-tyrosine/L-tryptophan isonitrile synthase family protein [Cyanobacteria bacterium HKST-UBA04]MCA9806693.1 L-tyrosine/L-tryptophan isonitrile synthase family protein [Cyanobacteria bacterium HKST-UBA06]MCA9841402.1 L-tyrosine/L-tryptophan isonitrile synthase family protein [Cyanobacteria bacterium HKST-UBA03]
MARSDRFERQASGITSLRFGQTTDTQAAQETARKVAQAIYAYQDKYHATCTEADCPTCIDSLAQRVLPFVTQERPLELVLPGFPYKSKSQKKCMGVRADAAELVAVERLTSLLDDVEWAYPKGAHLTIYSDGRSYCHVSGVCDNSVSTYLESMRELLDHARLADKIKIVSLEDIAPVGNPHAPVGTPHNWPAMRDWLLETYGQPLPEIQTAIEADPALQSNYQGMKCFRQKDLEGHPDTLVTDPATNQTLPYSEFGCKARRRICGHLALLGMQSAMAWGDLIDAQAPDALRLSVHAKPCGSRKFGISLTGQTGRSITPWHAVACELPKQPDHPAPISTRILVPRALAEEAGLEATEVDLHPTGKHAPGLPMFQAKTPASVQQLLSLLAKTAHRPHTTSSAP